MKFIPHKNRVILEIIEEGNNKVSKGGIVLPDSIEHDKPQRGRIVSFGKQLNWPDSMIGAEVLFKKYGPDEFTLNEKKYLICDEEDILMFMEND